MSGVLDHEKRRMCFVIFVGGRRRRQDEGGAQEWVDGGEETSTNRRGDKTTIGAKALRIGIDDGVCREASTEASLVVVLLGDVVSNK
ncbi:hypothetical protein MY1884_003406 [Beauveria asiatica]